MPTREDAAVSPVVGVVLMVAITLVLSALVFALLERFQEGRSEPPPAVAWSLDEGSAQLTVLRAPADLEWRDLEVSGSCAPLLNGGPFPPPAGVMVRPGDALACAPGEDLQVVSGPNKGNALLYRAEFT